MKPVTTIISVSQLQELLRTQRPCMIFDCTYDLAAPQAGRQQYLQAHIPGAVYADVGEDLSAAETAAKASGGRHPLPTREAFAQWLGARGFDNDMQAVVYDRNGNNFCGRLWWMLKWLGHEAVAVLDGGLQAWQAAGGAVESAEAAARTPAHFGLKSPLAKLLTADEVLRHLGDPEQTLVDARSPERWRGEVEPLDAKAGHIPGALNRPFSANMGQDGKFKPSAQLREEFLKLLNGRKPETVVHQCGSGISAIPNVLAMEIAGLGCPALFAGSWSEWSSDPSRPVESDA